MCSCDAEMPSVFTVKMVHGRRDYRCCECNVVLPKGTLHESYQGCWDGKFNTFRTCAKCLDLRKRVQAIDDCGCFQFGGLHEMAHEYDIDLEQVA